MSRQIQFCHDRALDSQGVKKAKGGRTVVMEKITLSEFEAVVPSLSIPAFILSVGVAVCSKKDNYWKAMGRQVAAGRSKRYNLYVTAKSADGLQLYNGELGLTFFLKKSEKTDDINFVDVL